MMAYLKEPGYQILFIVGTTNHSIFPLRVQGHLLKYEADSMGAQRREKFTGAKIHFCDVDSDLK